MWPPAPDMAFESEKVHVPAEVDFVVLNALESSSSKGIVFVLANGAVGEPDPSQHPLSVIVKHSPAGGRDDGHRTAASVVFELEGASSHAPVPRPVADGGECRRLDKVAVCVVGVLFERRTGTAAAHGNEPPEHVI